MRTVKEADERKKEILDVAERLFASKGFDKTSISNILDEVEIARGTLYYHFKSKEEIMDALISRQCEIMKQRALAIATDKAIPVYQRMVKTVLSLNVTGENHESANEMTSYMHRPQNALMHEKIQTYLLQSVPPILASVIEDGIDQGLFNTPYPCECMEMIIAYTNTVFDQLFQLTQDQMLARIRGLIFNMERMLGAKDSLEPYVMEMFGLKPALQ